MCVCVWGGSDSSPDVVNCYHIDLPSNMILSPNQTPITQRWRASSPLL